MNSRACSYCHCSICSFLVTDDGSRPNEEADCPQPARRPTTTPWRQRPLPSAALPARAFPTSLERGWRLDRIRTSRARLLLPIARPAIPTLARKPHEPRSVPPGHALEVVVIGDRPPPFAQA